MGLGSLKELYLDELGDLYDAETQMIRALPRFIELARAPNLREILAKHYDESRLHLERLQLIFTHWGQPVSPHPCAGIAGIVQEADDRLNQPATPDTRDAAIIGAAQRIEHYEIAAYGCARTYARRLNRTDDARLLQETLDEEGRADRRLTELAEASINDDAAAEDDERDSERTGRMQYIAASQLDYSRLSPHSLAVHNEMDDDLGDFDGLLIDTVSSNPQYIVVDASSVFVGRRYLLPVAYVRFDERGRLLRVNLEKDVAERYPPFNHDEFQAMSDQQVRGYERRLLGFFTTDEAAPATHERSGAVPAWLTAGVSLPGVRPVRGASGRRSEAADRLRG
jgi:ferritin-like metal-binding protein YciE